MRLSLDTDPQILTVRRYGNGELEVNAAGGGQLIRAPCILSPARLITEWAVREVSALDLAALEPILKLRPGIVLIGSTVPAFRVSPALRKIVEGRGVALETMDLGAACRTYNVLAQEHREVVAGLFP